MGSHPLTRRTFKILCWLLLAPALAVRAQSPPVAAGAPLKLDYHLVVSRPTTHLVEVEIDASGFPSPELDFVMPAWGPGRYAIYDYAKNVQAFEAQDAQGQPLEWRKLDKQTWRVLTAGAGESVRVRYQVFANDLTGSFSQFDTSHAALSGASVFMYVAGHKYDPLDLTVDAPQNWLIFSGFSLSPAQRAFRVPGYDRLVDTPLEISPECSVREFQEAGKTFRVVVHNYSSTPGDVDALADGLHKIVRSEMSMMPSPDFHDYTFLFHFAPLIALGDGMEHLNSTQIIIRGEADGAGLREALETAAHEFFHVWNVKRLRPAALGPFDYTREDYTRSLWFAEGVTSYYSYIHLLRSGLWTRQQFLDRLAGEIRDLQDDPGRELMSAESSSFNAWFYDRSPQMQETNFANSTISYYNKGALLGMLLDLEIRARTGGQNSLDGVLREMYRKFYQSPAATPYGPGRGYHEKDLQEAVSTAAGSDFGWFFKRYVSGTDELPYERVLALAGLKLDVSVAPGTPPSLGAFTEPTDIGEKIRAVIPGGAADRAELSRDDVLVDVDGLSLATASLSGRLQIYAPGAQVPFDVDRFGRRFRIMVTLDPPAPNQYSLEDLPAATPAEIKLRDQWLAGPWSKAEGPPSQGGS
jgi:predicted metalloprotease with PDZ domain